MKTNDTVIPELQENFENEPRKNFNPKQVKQIAIENTKIHVKQLNKEVVKKMINP